MAKSIQQIVSMLVLALSMVTGGVALGQIPSGYFTNIIPVLADPRYSDIAPSVTEDGLTMVFTNIADSGFPVRPETSGWCDLYLATRTTTEEPFGNIVNLGAPVNTSEPEFSGSLSPDGEILYFDSLRIPSPSGDWDIFQATREEDGTYGNAAPVAGVNTEFTDYMPGISADGLTLYYAWRPAYGVGQRRLWSASRETIEMPFGNAHELGNAVNGDPPVDPDPWPPDRSRPSISADEKFLFFHVDPNPEDIWVSYRETVNDSFGPPQNINDLWPGTEINTSGRDDWMSISRNWPAAGSKIYFTSDRLRVNRGDIFQATWVPGIAGDYNGDGVVDAADYTVWRDNLGSTTTLPNDPTPGMVDETDYDVWKAHFGQTAGGGTGQASSSQDGVPEPASLLLAMLAAAWLLARPPSAANRSC